jgi:hypothetical protein
VLGAALATVGALAQSWLDARTTERAELAREQRLLAAEVLRSFDETEAKLNAMQSQLELFVKSGKRDPATLSAGSSDMSRSYGEFDRVAWWWGARIAAQAPGVLPDARLSKLEEAIRHYNDAVRKSSEAIWQYHAICLDRARMPGDGDLKRGRALLAGAAGQRRAAVSAMLAAIRPR